MWRRSLPHAPDHEPAWISLSFILVSPDDMDGMQAMSQTLASAVSHALSHFTPRRTVREVYHGAH